MMTLSMRELPNVTIVGDTTVVDWATIGVEIQNGWQIHLQEINMGVDAS
jgi:hypothetical protein